MTAWADALLVARLAAADPHGIGGVVVRAGAGPVREAWLDALRKALPAERPVRRMPGSITDARLLGGLDLPATLAALEGADTVGIDHLARIAPAALRHRLRRNPLDESGSTARVTRAVAEVFAP